MDLNNCWELHALRAFNPRASLLWLPLNHAPCAMKKSFLFILISLLCLALPARADRASDLKDYINRVETCEAILQQFMARAETAIPPEVLKKAKAIVITNQLKAGVLFGVQDGYGVILVRRPTGRWGIPILLRAGEASVGLQLGVNTVEKVYVIQDETVPRLLFKDRINIGVDARAVAGPRYAETQADNKAMIDAPVLVYSHKAGLYAGATIKTGHLSRDDEANQVLYNTVHAYPELAYSDWVAPIAQVQPLINLLDRIAPAN